MLQPDRCNRLGLERDWYPIGSVAIPFTGTYDGRGHVIHNLTLAEVEEDDYQGLFGAIQSGVELIDIHLRGVGGAGDDYMGWLVGHMLDGTVTYCSAEGSNLIANMARVSSARSPPEWSATATQQGKSMTQLGM